MILSTFRVLGLPALLAVSLLATGQSYQLDVTQAKTDIRTGHLQLGGSNPKGDSIAVNNFYATLNGKPWIPIAGEFHYSRYPESRWEEAILKMKAGGINVIATYVFWNMHEEQEGQFNWQGNRDLKRFVRLCAQNNMPCIVRIGPFCHGEIRSGGIPDWIMGKALSIRSNDLLYLRYVERLYKEIGGQLHGMLYKEGGPVIGIQIENEYQHSAAPWGLTYPGQPHDFTASERDLSVTQEGVGIAEGNNPYAELGNDHMKVLKQLAVKAGLQVPLYTATGWGNAAIVPNASIPVTAAYAYPFWTEKKDQSPFFLYTDLHKKPDYSPVRYVPQDYPAFASELGSGIMSVYKRRPKAVHQSFDAMINRCLGSSANGIGYYMYHGGSTPQGNGYYFNDEAYGMPKISYDFQAPIGEYGQVREGFHRLKLLHFFVQDFGDRLAPMTTVLPANAATLTPVNVTDLRYAVRSDGQRGFLFVNNFQDDAVSTNKEDIAITLNTREGAIPFPAFSLPSGENTIFPFNFDMNGANLRYATAQLLMKGSGEKSDFFAFFTPEGVKAQFLFGPDVKIKPAKGIRISKTQEGSLVSVTGTEAEFSIIAKGVKTNLLLVPKKKALTSYVVNVSGHKRLLFSPATVLQDRNGKLQFYADNSPEFTATIYPAPKTPLKSAYAKAMGNGMWKFQLPVDSLIVTTKATGSNKLQVQLPATLKKHVADAILTVDYIGDTGMGFLDGKLVTDEFYKGIPWEIGLQQLMPFQKEQALNFYFRPMHKDASYFVDLDGADIPDFGDKKTYLKINRVSIRPIYYVEAE
ncbi:beta-galactosidase [Chitinophaga horti]|uniref:Beta-galactosidase n=1 Tax=Chitinophaga horti TaxID=2920382 RepID=A0ABY6IUE1_9BACT|nr:beta-galactosidase [Chitinophaga horti]UYQ90975.1 beta-galactosidase [Chitinophaga horti]